MLLSFIVDAKEEIDAAVINITDDFIQTSIENEKDMDIIKIREISVDMLLDIYLDVYGQCTQLQA